MNRADAEFVKLAIMELYDEEVLKHPEGIRTAEVRKLIKPKVVEILRNIRRDDARRS